MEYGFFPGVAPFAKPFGYARPVQYFPPVLFPRPVPYYYRRRYPRPFFKTGVDPALLVRPRWYYPI